MVMKELKRPSGNTKESKSNISECSLVLFNDDVNSYEFVIKTLIEVCNHDHIQAEQCTFIAHHKGKCEIKKDVYSALEQMKDELDRRGLTSVITKN